MHKGDICPGSSSMGLTMTIPPKSPSSHNFSTDVIKMPDVPPRPRGHRRAHSDIGLLLPEDAVFGRELDMQSPELPTLSDDAAEGLFNMYVDMEKMNTCSLPWSRSLSENYRDPPAVHHSRSISSDGVLGLGHVKGGVEMIVGDHTSPAHEWQSQNRHLTSMDGSIYYGHDLFSSDTDTVDEKKALTASKVADIALLDPKRAKRILANRQSAARSKERKVRYMLELEQKVQKLQTEATNLCTQVTILKQDENILTAENKELKFRLQAMEQQSQLQNALNDALKEEVQRLKLTKQLASSHRRPMDVRSRNFPASRQIFTLPQLQQTAEHFQRSLQTQETTNDESMQQTHVDFSSKVFRPL